MQLSGALKNQSERASRGSALGAPGLPRGFVKIQHCGLLSPTNVNGRLTRAKALLCRNDPHPANAATADAKPEHVAPKAGDLPWAELLFALTGIDLTVCPACRAAAMVRFPLPLPPDCRGPPAKALPN